MIYANYYTRISTYKGAKTRPTRPTNTRFVGFTLSAVKFYSKVPFPTISYNDLQTYKLIKRTKNDITY